MPWKEYYPPVSLLISPAAPSVCLMRTLQATSFPLSSWLCFRYDTIQHCSARTSVSTRRSSGCHRRIECGWTEESSGGQSAVYDSFFEMGLRCSVSRLEENWRPSTAQNGSWICHRAHTIEVAREKWSLSPTDPLDPGHVWNNIGIYQCNVENDKQSPSWKTVFLTGTAWTAIPFGTQNPDKMLFHMWQERWHLSDWTGKIREASTRRPIRRSHARFIPSLDPGGTGGPFGQRASAWVVPPERSHQSYLRYSTKAPMVVYDTQYLLSIRIVSRKSRGDCLDPFLTFHLMADDFFCSAPARPMPQGYTEEMP